MKALVTLLSLASILAHAEPLEAASLKVYKGTEGQRVDVLRLKPITANAALVRVRQSGSPFDGLVLRCEVDERNGRLTTRFRGSPWSIVHVNDGGGRIYFPEVKEFSVKFDEAATAQLTAAELITDHEKQRAHGKLAMFAKKEFPHLTKKYEGKAAAALAELKNACPSATSFVIDWSSFSDDDMENVDIWSVCQPLAALARSRCGAVSQLVCRRGQKLEVVRSGGTLTFFTTQAGAGVDLVPLLGSGR